MDRPRLLFLEDPTFLSPRARSLIVLASGLTLSSCFEAAIPETGDAASGMSAETLETTISGGTASNELTSSTSGEAVEGTASNGWTTTESTAGDETTTGSSTISSAASDTNDTVIPPNCGDNHTDPDEECDKGEYLSNNSACTLSCRYNVCNDGHHWIGEEICDDGNTNFRDGCIDCIPARCGDGFLRDGTEDCDDGNERDGDTCPSNCQLDSETTGDSSGTGDGNQESGTGADDGADESSGCATSCGENYCGDGSVLPGVEDCDDGNDNPDDGCDNCEVREVCDGVCMPSVPVGWTGPAILVEGTTCGGNYPVVETQSLRDTVGAVPPATCGCSCGPVQGMVPADACPLPFEVQVYTGVQCSNTAFDSFEFSAFSDVRFYAQQFAGFIYGRARTRPSQPSGTCAPNPSVTIEPAPPPPPRALCIASDVVDQGCQAGEVCASEPTGGQGVCVFREGDRTCPSSYPDRSIYFSDLRDTRTCSACTCEAPSGGECAETVEFRDTNVGRTLTVYGDACGAASFPNPNAGNLHDVDIRALPTSPTPASEYRCEASEVTPQGELSMIEPITICCSA